MTATTPAKPQLGLRQQQQHSRYSTVSMMTAQHIIMQRAAGAAPNMLLYDHNG
jgi:hypothetical protein